jgi:hypothetical protein
MRTTAAYAALTALTVCLAACAVGTPAGTAPAITPVGSPASTPIAAVHDSDASAFCALAAGSGELFNPRDSAPDATAVSTYLPKALAVAPAEIRPDVEVIVEIEQPIVEHRVSPGEVEKRLEDPRLDEAAQHVADYVQTHCVQ